MVKLKLSWIRISVKDPSENFRTLLPKGIVAYNSAHGITSPEFQTTVSSLTSQSSRIPEVGTNFHTPSKPLLRAGSAIAGGSVLAPVGI